MLDSSLALNSIDEFPVSVKEPLVQSVFEEWSAYGIQEAMDRANQLKDPSRLWALKGLLIAHNGLSDSEKRNIARRFGAEQIFIDLAAKAIADEQIENPHERWGQIERF